MATFPSNYVPTYGMSVERQFNVKSTKFGDGYERRSADGVNNVALTFNLTFSKLLPAQIQEIDAFLCAMGGYTAFEWTPPSPWDYPLASEYVVTDHDIDPHYVAGNVVKKRHTGGDPYIVYVCIDANNHTTGAKDPETQPLYWLPVTRLPMLFVCRKGGWSYDSYNATSLNATFEQVFDIA
jgi:phage-related protein